MTWFNLEKRKSTKPKYDIGDIVEANWHSTAYRGKKFKVLAISNKTGSWFATLEPLDNHRANINLYAYKLDLVSRTRASNNEELKNLLFTDESFYERNPMTIEDFKSEDYKNRPF